MKIRPLGAELFHADGWMDTRRDRTKLIVVFRNYAKSALKRNKTEINIIYPTQLAQNC